MVDIAKLGNEAHFIFFATIIAASNGKEGLNFRSWSTVIIVTIKMSGNRLVHGHLYQWQHADVHSVDEIGGGAHEMELINNIYVGPYLDLIRCRNGKP